MGKSKSGSSNMCLSQSGAAPGNADLAASSSIIASSTLDFAHGAALAVDVLDSSYWVIGSQSWTKQALSLERLILMSLRQCWRWGGAAWAWLGPGAPPLWVCHSSKGKKEESGCKDCKGLCRRVFKRLRCSSCRAGRARDLGPAVQAAL